MLYTVQRWARAYRDQTFHEFINNNNGTEALNKVLKYTYLPRGKRSTNLSGIVTTLLDIFLPALRQKYLFSNFEQTSTNRKYKDYIPTYLYDRPKTVILHCLDRKARSCKFEAEDVTNMSDGVFEVKSGENVYTINFKGPSCSCNDWIQTNYPCKHFFAVFQHFPAWSWYALPSSYLESPRLTLDTEALEVFFKDNHSTSTPSDAILEGEHEGTSCVRNYTRKIPERKVKCSIMMYSHVRMYTCIYL